MFEKDTICAIATAPGGAIGVVRVSGPEAISITEQIFRPSGSVPLAERPTASLAFGNIVALDGSIVDEVLVSIFRAPHSYTGEDCTEISCHGSTFILNTVVKLLVGAGCRLARGGEYTQRAYLNGKMDLSQAEAVADLIASHSAMQHKLAMQNMKGEFSKELKKLRDQLLHITSLMELELDFSDHDDLEFADRRELDALAKNIEIHLARLCKSFGVGNAIKNGVPVAIVGETNSGKSTLLNALVGEEKAIVSNIEGTTRDIIEDSVDLDGISFNFIDTAGLRHTTDEIEQIGISRALKAISGATIVVWVIDITKAKEQFDSLLGQVSSRLGSDTKVLLLLNKSDLTSHANSVASDMGRYVVSRCKSIVMTLPISAHNPSDIKKVCELLPNLLPDYRNETLVTSARHYEALSNALLAIKRVEESLAAGIPSDLISQDLRECLYHLAEITGGEITPTEVLSSIFSRFCVGK